MRNIENELELTVCSNASNICSTTRQVIDFIKQTNNELNPESLFEVKVILNELVTNAICHGNKNIDEKYVKLKVAMIQGDLVQIKVVDEGQGFDYKSIVAGNNICECWEPENMKECGRGLSIVKNLSETICFNEKGNEIFVVYKLS